MKAGDAKFCLERAAIARCPSEACKARGRNFFQRRGYFRTRWNGQPVRRYRCKQCGKFFSSHTFRPSYRQKRPDINDAVFQFYASGVSQRRLALLLKVNRKTVVRKFRFLAELSRSHHARELELAQSKSTLVHFDEMETFEHTRLKPVTIALSVCASTGRVLSTRAEPIAYKGPLAALAFKKYGPRPHRSAHAVRSVLKHLSQVTRPALTLVSDANPSYRKPVRELLPHAQHIQAQRIPAKTDRKNFNDPLFTLNYTAAKLRNDLSRLGRRTWVTTKRIQALQDHLDLYLAWNNGFTLRG